jgi:hypothetical protein
MLLLCPRAWEVWTFFFPDFSAGRPFNLADLWAMRCRNLKKQRSSPPSPGTSGREEMPGLSMA